MIQFKVVLNRSEPIEELHKLLDPRLGLDSPIEAIYKVKIYNFLFLQFNLDYKLKFGWNVRWLYWEKLALERTLDLGLACDLLWCP